MIPAASRLSRVNEYYFSHKLREVRALQAAGNPVLNMGIGSPDLPPPPAVLETLVQSISHAGAHQYQSYQGLPELRGAMARFYQRHYGVRLEATKEILPLMGSKEGILHISMAFLNPGDAVLIPNPGYPTYASVTALCGADALFYDLEETHGWLPNLEALEAQDLSRVKIMWINYPHMPTGATATMEAFEKLIGFAKKHHILLVNDNPYSFVLNDNPISLMAVPGAREVGIELNSLSKTFNLAGWRVGMLVGDAKFLEPVLSFKSNMDSGMFYGLQKAAVQALDSGPEWFEALNAVYSRRRDKIFELAQALGCSFDRNAAGMFVWAKLPSGAATCEQTVDELLYKHHIFVAPGSIFGSRGAGYIRFSLCVPETQIETALERITAAV